MSVDTCSHHVHFENERTWPAVAHQCAVDGAGDVARRRAHFRACSERRSRPGWRSAASSGRDRRRRRSARRHVSDMRRPSARGRACSTTSVASSARSTGSSCRLAARRRRRGRAAADRPPVDPCARLLLRLRPPPRDGSPRGQPSRRSNARLPRMMVIGLRSSCDVSASRRRCDSSMCSRRAIISLNVAARKNSSSPWPKRGGVTCSRCR